VDILIMQDARQSLQPSNKEKEPKKLAAAIFLVK
jgi:hypothetical protein